MSLIIKVFLIQLTDEWDCSDIRMIADEVDGLVRAVDDVDDSVGHASFLQEINLEVKI